MTAVLFGLLVTIVLSILILLGVAVPHLRAGGRILSPDGERLARRTRRQTSGRRRAGREPGPSRGRVPSHRSRSFRIAHRHASPHHGVAVLPPAPGATSQPPQPAAAPEPDRVIDLRDGVPIAEQHGEGRRRQ